MLEGKGQGLTFLVLQLNTLLDSEKYDNISIEEVYQHIDDGSILQFLRSRAGEDMDLSSHLSPQGFGGNFEQEYVADLQAIYDVYRGQHDRRWRVQRKGLCLLLAWTNELLQMGSGWQPTKLARR